MALRVPDNEWVRQSFLVTKNSLKDMDHKRRFFSTASYKFTDTTLGGNFAINMPPQFTSNADIKVKGLLSSDKSLGMGRYYSEAIDDNSQIIHMRFGVPMFNKLTTFFTGFYDSNASELARTGRSSSAFFELGKAAGFVVSVIAWPLLVVNLVGNALRFALQKPSSKFYYLKPTMPMYWNAVTTMVNQLAVNRGIVPRLGNDEQTKFNPGYEFDKAAITNLHKMLPDVIDANGTIDVYSMANRAQRLAIKQHKAMMTALDTDADGSTYESRMASVLSEGLSDTHRMTLPMYLEKWFASEPVKQKAASNNTTNGSGDMSSETYSKEESMWTKYGEFLDAELDDGSAFASFRVNYTGPMNESFSNSVGESEMGKKMNDMSSSSRVTRFDFADGNIGGGTIGAAVQGAFGAVKDLVQGIGAGLELSGIAALAGSAFVDIPKHWQSATANLPRANYTINLRSVYGNPISQVFNLDVPLCMLLASVLPLSTGKQSYTSPFLVELYDRGRCQTRLGIVDSMSITRGVGNLGFTQNGKCLGIDVTFSVIDLSSIMHMPIAQSFSLKDAAVAAGNAVGGAAGAGIAAVLTGAFDDDTVFTDYMNVLAGVGLTDQIYSFRKLKMQLTKRLLKWDNWTSPTHWVSIAGDTPPGRLVSAFYKGTIK